MDLRRTSVLALAICALASIAMPAGAFIGAGIDLSNHLGDTIEFELSPLAVTAADSAYGLAAMDLGVTWGVDYDLSSMAGYPYGYGGIGAVTDATIGYDLGISMDNAYAAGFDGSTWGIPLTTGTSSKTSYDNSISAVDHLQDTQASLVYY